MLPSNLEPRVKHLKSVLLRLRLKVVLSTVLTLVCAAGICWGLFGQNSTFNTANIAIFERNELELLTSTNSATRCRPLETEKGIGRTALPDLRLVPGFYKLTNAFGVEYLPAPEISWRQFPSILLEPMVGLALGTVTDISNLIRSPVRRIALASDGGSGSLITERNGTSFASTLAPLPIMETVIGIYFKLFDTYGVRLLAIGLVSSLDSAITFHTVPLFAENATSEWQALPIYSAKKKIADVGSMIGASASAVARGVSSGSTVPSSLALLAGSIQESGLTPSPRQLAGSATVQPSRHMADIDIIIVVNVNVSVSTILCILLLCLFATLLLSGRYEGQGMMWNISQHLGQFSRPGIQSVRYQVPSLQASFARCVNIAFSSAIIEIAIPRLLGIVVPLIIGSVSVSVH